MPKIKYCCRNFKLGSKVVYKALKSEFPDMKHKKKDCIGSCGACSKVCMALIGKTELVRAKTPELLYEKLKQRIG
ncbi:DUF1450 domain-containing protein [Cohnella thailandensis]|jgi:Uncharacterized protein conserved in bacteria|uniref:DUF1450 domain-containing protein n=1 Tax=Cohnella thailandensis TaxID=557557 RepID=A0A841SZ89_9BACL|nr:DUF1450 domain-containing protein [Cohnella thailandensis]MBB6637224.1 DUF1450 domain-containing protein [Cohnella thailandensis]MBP1976954.1 uncharacterized protein YuzB (UPF0349 family) [Cohnella thailandensis]